MINFRRIIFPLLLSSSFCWGQAVQQPMNEWNPPIKDKFEEKPSMFEPEVREKIERDDLNDIDFAFVETLLPHQEEYRRQIPLEPDPPRKIIWPTRRMHAMLRENSILTDVKTNKKVYTYRKSYTMAEELEAGGGEIVIYDRFGNKRYITNAINVVFLDKDLDLDSRPLLYNEYERPENFNADDEELRIQNYFSVHGEIVQDEYLGDLFGSLLPEGVELESETFSAWAIRFEYQAFYKWQLPIEFGINLNYQEGAWLGQADGLIWRSIFFGPIARYPLYRGEDFNLNFHMSFQKSLYYKATSLTEAFTFSYSTNALEAGLTFDIPSKEYGHLVVGGTLRRAKASLKETSGELERKSTRGQMLSGSIYVGWGFEFAI